MHNREAPLWGHEMGGVPNDICVLWQSQYEENKLEGNQYVERQVGTKLTCSKRGAGTELKRYENKNQGLGVANLIFTSSINLTLFFGVDTMAWLWDSSKGGERENEYS